MRGRKPDELVLKSRDVAHLRELLRNGQTPQKVARRARILLSRAEGQRVETVGEKVEQNPSTVWRVCQRYWSGGLEAALYDAPRSGRPRVFFQPGTPAD